MNKKLFISLIIILVVGCVVQYKTTLATTCLFSGAGGTGCPTGATQGYNLYVASTTIVGTTTIPIFGYQANGSGGGGSSTLIYAGTGIGTSASGTNGYIISNTGVTSFNGATGTVTYSGGGSSTVNLIGSSTANDFLYWLNTNGGLSATSSEYVNASGSIYFAIPVTVSSSLNAGTSTALFTLYPNTTYGSSNQNLQDGALNINCSLDNGICEQVYSANASSVGPEVFIYQENATDPQPVLKVQGNSSSATAIPIQLKDDGYDAIEFWDTSQNNASGTGLFQLDNRNGTFRFEGRNASDTSFDIDGLFNQPAAGGQFIWGGNGQSYFSMPANQGLFNIVEGQSTTLDYLDISATTTSPGNIFKITSAGNVNASGTFNASGTISQAGVPVLTTSTGLTTANFASANISQWTNDAGFVTSTGISSYNVTSGNPFLTVATTTNSATITATSAYVSSIVAGTNITISNATGSVTINASGGGSSSSTNVFGVEPILVSQSGTTATTSFDATFPMTISGLYTFTGGVSSTATTTLGNVVNLGSTLGNCQSVGDSLGTNSNGKIECNTNGGTLTGNGASGYLPYYSGTITFATSSLYEVSSTGNIGIGTTTATVPLNVAGTIDSTALVATGVIQGNVFEGNAATISGETGGVPYNLFNQNYSGQTNETGPAFQYASSSGNGIRLVSGAGGVTTSTANANYSTFLVVSSPLLLPATGINNWASSAVVNGLGNVSSSGATLENTASLYVGSSSSQGVNNYTLYAATGTDYLGGTTTVEGALLDANGNPYVTSTYGAGAYLGVSGSNLTVSSTLASSSVAFLFYNATTSAPYNLQNIQTSNKKNVATVSCFEYAAATSTIELYYNTTLASSGIQQVILSSLTCGNAGTSTTSFTTSTIPAGAYLWADVTGIAGTPTLTTINVQAQSL